MKELFGIILSSHEGNRILPPRYDRKRQEHIFIRRLIFLSQKKAYFSFPTNF